MPSSTGCDSQPPVRRASAASRSTASARGSKQSAIAACRFWLGSGAARAARKTSRARAGSEDTSTRVPRVPQSPTRRRQKSAIASNGSGVPHASAASMIVSSSDLIGVVIGSSAASSAAISPPARSENACAAAPSRAPRSFSSFDIRRCSMQSAPIAGHGHRWHALRIASARCSSHTGVRRISSHSGTCTRGSAGELSTRLSSPISSTFRCLIASATSCRCEGGSVFTG